MLLIIQKINKKKKKKKDMETFTLTSEKEIQEITVTVGL